MQFMCVSISNVTVVTQVSEGRRLVHASVNNLSLDGSILPRSQIAICVLVDAFSARLLQAVPAGTNENREQLSAAESPESSRITNKTWQPCLSEFSIGFQTEIHVDPVKPIIQV